MNAPSPPIINAPLLHELLSAGEPRTIDALATSLGTPAEQVRADLDRLHDAGCVIDHFPHRGVQLRQAGLGAWVDYLQWRRPGRAVEVYRTTASTQDAARQMAVRLGPAADGAVVIADAQTAGRGRLGRRWHAPPGRALLFSRVFSSAAPPPADARPSAPAQGVDYLTFTAAVVIARAMEAICGRGLRVHLKWPNDLLVGGQKLAGLLVETIAPAVAILGVGINVSTQLSDLADLDPADRADLAGRMTSLAMAGVAIDRLRLLDAVLAGLDGIAIADTDQLLADWRDRCVQMAQVGEFIVDGWPVRGQVIDLDPAEGLIVRTDSGGIVHLPAATTQCV